MEAEHRLTETQRQNVVALIEALESGKYKRVSRALRTVDGYCVTGVMCDLSGLGKWEQWQGTDKFQFAIDYDGHIWRWLNFPPYDVYDHFGLPHHFAMGILNLNDNCGASFAEIARRLRIWLDMGASEDVAISAL